MIGIFIISTAIGIHAARGPASDQSDAYNALTKAAYIETGMNHRVEYLEKRYVPTVIKEYGGWIAGTTRLILDQQISFEWTF